MDVSVVWFKFRLWLSEKFLQLGIAVNPDEYSKHALSVGLSIACDQILLSLVDEKGE